MQLLNTLTSAHNQILPARLQLATSQVRAAFLDAVIILLVCEHAQVPINMVFHHSRCREQVAKARQLAMYLLHVCAGRSMAEVGELFFRDRTTVAHACAKIEDLRDCPKFDADVSALEAAIEALSSHDDGKQVQ